MEDTGSFRIFWSQRESNQGQPVRRVVFEAEASGGEVRQVVSPPFPFHFPSPPPFHSPKFSDKPVGGKVRSIEGGSSPASPYKYHPASAFCLVFSEKWYVLFLCLIYRP